MNSKPTEVELSDRIARQMEWRGPTDAVVLVWRGYLAGLYEWGSIELGVYERLTKTLPSKGFVEIDELFAGEKSTKERELELRQTMNK